MCHMWQLFPLVFCSFRFTTSIYFDHVKFLIFLPCHEAYRIIAPQPGIEPRPYAVKE